eukprot:1423646-Amphidinium_carterae.1
MLLIRLAWMVMTHSLATPRGSFLRVLWMDPTDHWCVPTRAHIAQAGMIGWACRGLAGLITSN